MITTTSFNDVKKFIQLQDGGQLVVFNQNMPTVKLDTKNLQQVLVHIFKRSFK